MTSKNRLIFILASGLLVGGCATPKKVNPFHDLSDRVKQLEADKKSCAQALTVIQRDLAYKNERLNKFNQLDKKGRLRGATDCFNNPENCGNRVTGKETWQK